MEVYERIRELRKNHLKLTQENFGEILGVNRSVIKNIELNVLARPDQKEPLYKLICKTFNVNYEWLTTGEGEMQVETKDSFVKRLSAEYGLNFFLEKIVSTYLNLEGEALANVNAWFDDIAKAIKETPASEPVSVVAELEKRTLYNQKKAARQESVNMEAANELSLEDEADAFAAIAAERARAEFLKEKRQESQIFIAKESDAV